MPYRTLGSCGLRVPNIGLGTWKIGYPEKGDGSRVNERTAFEIFDRALELGVCFWDTANRYNNASGNSERVIGSWIRNNACHRRNIMIATKLGGCMDGHSPNHCGLSRMNIIESVYASIERLQVNYIDLLYFHAFDPLTPVEESMAAIEDLVQRDLIRYFAVSNFTVGQLQAWQSIHQKHSVRSKIVAIQNQFDLINGESERYKGVQEYALKHGIGFIAWSPMVRGLLAGKYLDLEKIGAGDRLFDEGMMAKTADGSTMKKINELARLAHQWDMQLNQLVLAYMLHLPGMGPVIPAVSNTNQLTSNASAGTICLTPEQQIGIKELLQVPDN
jgi:aryl-alcohol dehydrogenase-like predicted oxidoreductase